MVVHAGKKETGTPLADTPTRPATRHGGMRDLHESSFSLSGKSGAAVALRPPGLARSPASGGSWHQQGTWPRRGVPITPATSQGARTATAGCPGIPPLGLSPPPPQGVPAAIPRYPKIIPTSRTPRRSPPSPGWGPWQSREWPQSWDLQPPSPRPSLRAPSVVWLRWLGSGAGWGGAVPVRGALGGCGDGRSRVLHRGSPLPAPGGSGMLRAVLAGTCPVLCGHRGCSVPGRPGLGTGGPRTVSVLAQGRGCQRRCSGLVSAGQDWSGLVNVDQGWSGLVNVG